MGPNPARVFRYAWGFSLIIYTARLCAANHERNQIPGKRPNGSVRRPLQTNAADRALSAQASIPKILHQVLMSPGPGEPSPKANLSAYTAKWRAHCQEVFSDWEYHLWDNDAAEELLRSKFPDFIDTWESYDMVVLRGDAIRPLVMQTYGGLYLDADTECYEPADKWLDGYSLVFQAEQDGEEHLNNGAMASTKGHPFWRAVIDGMMERAYIFDVGANYAPVKEGDWETNILWRVGPLLLRDTFAEWKKAVTMEAWSQNNVKSRPVRTRKSPLAHARRHHKVWPVGEFYFPCNWKNLAYCYEVDDMKEKPAELAGRHWFSGTWRETNSKMKEESS